jgi:hypothetical protein
MTIRFLATLATAALVAGCASLPPTAAPSTTAAAVPLDHLPALRGGYHRIDSQAVGRPFHVYVRLPEDYDASPGKTYPIVYLLDGDSLFPILAASHLFIHYDDGLPDAIVVGIAYGGFGPVNRRSVDYMPPSPRTAPAAAGAPAFAHFLKDEVIPLVERTYRADPTRRILFGQSLGGTFVLYSAFTDPDLFWARIASNPSIEPGRHIFFGTPAAAARPDLRLIIASGSRDRPRLREGALEWARSWAARPPAPWVHRLIDIDGGTHAADAPNAYRAALRWLFAPQAATN